MKQYIIYMAILAACVQIHADSRPSSLDTEVSGRSFLALEPHFHSGSPEYISGFRFDRTHMLDDGYHGAFEVAIFGSKSHHSQDLTRYFFPNGKESLIVGEQTSLINPTDEFTDILAANLNIFTVGDNFRNRITIHPKQSVVGGALHLRKSFRRCEERCRGWWFDVLLPISRVKNELNLEVTDLNAGNDETIVPDLNFTAYNSVIDAFNQDAFMYGKISDCADQMKRTAVSDMELKVGIEWLDCEGPCHLESYLGVIIPTSKRDDAEYLFEAVNGYNGSAGLIWGGSAGIEIWNKQEKDQTLRVETTSNSRYLFKRNQMRTLDVKNKPWSRYASVYANLAEAQEAEALLATSPINARNMGTPGVNVFTRQVSVTPGFAYTQNMALVYNRCRWQAEVGYNFFARRSERVALKCSETNATLLPAIKDLTGAGATRPISDITGNEFLLVSTYTPNPAALIFGQLPMPVARYTESVITDDQLDLASAATPNILENTVYGSFGCNHICKDHPVYGNFGASFTFSKSNNASIERWTIWGKFGISF